MERLLGFFVRRHLLVNVAAVAMVVLGYLSATSLQREFIPSVDTPILWITATLPGASARDVETKVTIPIEEALEEVEGIDEFTTVISDNTSFTTVELLDDYTAIQIEAAEQEVRAALDDITDFPDDMQDEPVLKQFNPARSTVIEVALTGPPEDVGRTADFLEKRIERLPLIASVTRLGVADPEVRVLVDPVLAREHRITLIDILTAIRNRNISSTGGMLESAEDRRQVVMWSRYDQPTDVADTILRFRPDGSSIRVRDIARVEAGREDTGLVVHVNGSEGAVLTVQKRENADIVDAANSVRELLAETPLPESVQSDLMADESFIIRNRLELMTTNGIIGAILVAAVLFAFVRPRPALWILVGLPVVFLGGVALFGQTGMSLNMMALTGFVIVLGMVVDDAVVVSERIVFKQAQGLTPVQAAVQGTAEMVPPVTAAALTTMLAFLPLVFLGGMPGKIVWQIPAVVVIVLAFSLIESFFILPAHLSTVRDTVVEKRAFVLRLERIYRRMLQWVMRHRALTVLIAFGGFFAIMIFVRPLVPFVLFPQDDADRLFVKVTTAPGTSLEQTAAISSTVEAQIARIAEVDLDLVTARIGHQNTDSLDKQFGDADNEAVIVVQFKRLGRVHTNAQWMEILPQEIAIPADTKLVYLSEYFGPPTDQPVTVHVLSNEDAVRRAAAFEIETYLKSVPGVVEIEIDERPGTPQIDLNLNYEKLALRGLTAQEVGTTLAAAFYGIEATEHRDLDDTTELRVQFDPAARMNLDALLETELRARNGELVKLRDVVDPIEIPAVTRIFHRDGFRSSTVRASFSESGGLTALTFAQQLERELFPRFADVPGLIVFNGGEAVETSKTTGSIGIAALLAVVGIGIVIWLMLGSFLEALFVLLIIPFAVASVFLIFFLHGKPLSMFAMMGAVGLAGVVVNASIVMVDSIHRRVHAHNPEAGGEPTEVIIDAVVERLRPILVTTLTTLGGVLPTAYGIGGYDPIVAIISLAIGWGLAVSTLVTLFLVPALYTLAGDVKRLTRRRRSVAA